MPTRSRLLALAALLAMAALLAEIVPTPAARADEPSRLANPLGLRAREEVFIAPPPRAAPQRPTAPRADTPREPVPRPTTPRADTPRESVPRPTTPRADTPREPAARATTPPATAPHATAQRETSRRDAPARNAAPRDAAPNASARTRAPARRPRRPAPPCLSPPVEMVRVDGPRRESQQVSLTFCDGRPRPEALEALSVLARPHRVDAPEASAIRAYARRVARRPRRGETRPDPNFVVEGVRRLDAGLVPRVARIATHFPGKAIEIVSGWRPNERPSSRHHQARAIDVRVRGVSRETLRDFARTLDETGVGYYPNSVFVHVDVRDTRSYWVDRSGPGEEADYGTWPPTNEERRRVEERVVASALATLERLRDVAPPVEGDEPRGASPASTAQDEEANDAANADADQGAALAPPADGTTAERATDVTPSGDAA